MIVSKQLSVIAPIWYSAKMHVTCIKGPKANNTFREALKIYLDDGSESFLKKMWQFYKGHVIASKLWSVIAPVWY